MKGVGAGMSRLGAAMKVPGVPVKSDSLRKQASELGHLIWKFNLAVNRALITYREPIMDMQLIQERIANAAMEMFASACVLSRLDSELQGVSQNGATMPGSHRAADLFLRQSYSRIRRFLSDLTGNDDRELLATADAVLGKGGVPSKKGR